MNKFIGIEFKHVHGSANHAFLRIPYISHTGITGITRMASKDSRLMVMINNKLGRIISTTATTNGFI